MPSGTQKPQHNVELFSSIPLPPSTPTLLRLGSTSKRIQKHKSQKIDVVLTVLKEAFKRSISGGKKGEDSCALSMRNNVQRVLEPTTSSYYRKAHVIIVYSLLH
ncbi:hypothetical protein Bca101_071587 [Brassica carinata]